MEVKFYNQPKDTNLYNLLSDRLRESFEKVWLCAGFAKDSAIDIMLGDIENAIKNNTQVELMLGHDNKNTSKDMLLKLLNAGCKIRYHLNTDDSKFESRAYYFEKSKGNSYIYITGSKFSEGGITNNLSLIMEVSYTKEEKKEFSMARVALESGVASDELFAELTEEKLADLAKMGEIVARITERRIPSISERYSGETNTDNLVSEYNDEADTSNYKDLLNKDFDIDIVDEENVITQQGLGDEVEHKLKATEKEEIVRSKIVHEDSDVDFERMSTLIFPLSKTYIKEDEIKLPSAITMNMNSFFEYPKDYHMEQDEKGELHETKQVIFEVIENENNTKMLDVQAKLVISSKYLSLKSECFKNINLGENDIVRIIKEDVQKYRCEIIKANTNEYEIWEAFCKTTVKGSSKKFGIM